MAICGTEPLTSVRSAVTPSSQCQRTGDVGGKNPYIGRSVSRGETAVFSFTST